MSPLDRRRRRRSLRPRLLAALAAAVVVLLLAGGIAEISRQAAPYRRDVNSSYAAQAALVIGRSNQTGAAVRRLMAGMAAMDRPVLFGQIDTVAALSSQLAATAADLAPPAPTVGGLPTVLADRASAVAELHRALSGILGRGGPSLSPARAAAEITGAGALLLRADRLYAAVRREFHSAPGRASLPPSTWITDPRAWSAGSSLALVQQLAGSATLQARATVVLVPGTLRIVPAAVPPRVASAGPSTIPPTSTLQPSVVVADRGNVDAPGVRVSARVSPQGAGTADSTFRDVSLTPSGSVAVTLPGLEVVPGRTYTLTVSVAGGTGTAASTSVAVRIAPPTPTTTTTTAPATTRPKATTTTAPRVITPTKSAKPAKPTKPTKPTKSITSTTPTALKATTTTKPKAKGPRKA